MGLLSKASLISSETKLAFSDFISKFNIKYFAIFSLDESHYSIVNSYGFDGASLLASYSTKDFWDGICNENDKVYQYKCDDKTLNPMLQFFSFELMDNIKSVSLYKLDNCIYMLCNEDFNTEIINTLKLIDFNKELILLDTINKQINRSTQILMYEINFKEAVANFISLKGKEVKNNENTKLSLYNELINRFSCGLCKFCTTRIATDTIKTLFIIDKSIQEEHLICHIVYTLKKVLNSGAELISFKKIGIAESINELKTFLQVD